MQQRYLQRLERSFDMKRYVVEITDEALLDMEKLYNHIALNLSAPENAIVQYNK